MGQGGIQLSEMAHRLALCAAERHVALLARRLVCGRGALGLLGQRLLGGRQLVDLLEQRMQPIDDEEKQADRAGAERVTLGTVKRRLMPDRCAQRRRGKAHACTYMDVRSEQLH